MTTILAAIFVFGVLITVHEFGHFITAKMTGMRVDEFAIGFGPNIFQKKIGETLYSLRIIPLGGYNKIAGMDPDEPASADSFKSKSIPARMLVILAGSLMNFLLPVLLFFSIFMINGIQKPVDLPVLGTIMEDKAAAKAGLVAGDRIISINGENIATWNDLVVTLQKYPDKEITVIAEHQGEVKNYQMVPAYDAQYGRPLIGISPKYEQYQPGVMEAAHYGCRLYQTYYFCYGRRLTEDHYWCGSGRCCRSYRCSQDGRRDGPSGHAAAIELYCFFKHQFGRYQFVAAASFGWRTLGTAGIGSRAR